MILRVTLTLLERKLREAGVGMSALEARYLLCEAAEIPQSVLITDGGRAMSDAAQAKLEAMIARRLAGEPLARVLGHAEFWGLSLKVTPDVLDPRSDTETLVRAAVELFKLRKHEPLRILDLGTGSGALLCALLTEFPAATGLGIDVSAAAVMVARENLARNQLEQRGKTQMGNWGAVLKEQFDLVVSNPPYIESADIATLDVSVKDYDPLLALDGGADGFDAYRLLVKDFPRLLKSGGLAILEAGAGQAGGIAALYQQAGFANVLRFQDYGGHERAVAAFMA